MLGWSRAAARRISGKSCGVLVAAGMMERLFSSPEIRRSRVFVVFSAAISCTAHRWDAFDFALSAKQGSTIAQVARPSERQSRAGCWSRTLGVEFAQSQDFACRQSRVCLLHTVRGPVRTTLSAGCRPGTLGVGFGLFNRWTPGQPS